MKRQIAIILTSVLLPVLGAADFRINVSGIKGTASAPCKTSAGVTLSQASWLKAKKDNTLSCDVKVTGEWKKYSFSFIPKASGRFTISLMSSNARSFAACDDITITGATLKNGNFEQLNSKGEPEGWMKMKNPRFSNSEGVNNSNCSITAHNDRWLQIINCTEGQEVTITFYARSAK